MFIFYLSKRGVVGGLKDSQGPLATSRVVKQHLHKYSRCIKDIHIDIHKWNLEGSEAGKDLLVFFFFILVVIFILIVVIFIMKYLFK